MSAASELQRERHHRLAGRLREQLPVLGRAPLMTVEGSLTRVVGLTLEAVGCQVQIGSRCRVVDADGAALEAEVVGFAGDRVHLMPIGDLAGIAPHARVIPLRRVARVNVGLDWLGRVLDGEGDPLDGGPKPRSTRL